MLRIFSVTAAVELRATVFVGFGCSFCGGGGSELRWQRLGLGSWATAAIENYSSSGDLVLVLERWRQEDPAA
jgi:hypothetical protein